jgi:ribosome-associated heat shock protein Hsp15
VTRNGWGSPWLITARGGGAVAGAHYSGRVAEEQTEGLGAGRVPEAGVPVAGASAVRVPDGPEAARVDSWIWSVRLARTRSAAATAVKGGHVRVNGVRVKPAHLVRPGDEVRVRQAERDRIVVVTRVITKRVGAPVAAGCYVDNSPPPPPREMAAPVAARDRGAGRPTKRDRRSIEKLIGRSGFHG